MDNHPIPQDITGFEFKLIGDMTIKQFAYIAGGVVIAFVIYLFPIWAIIKIPIALCVAGIGAAMAFLPVGGRTMDVMIINFFKAVFSPTQYVYQKAGGQIYEEDQTNLSPAGKLIELSQKQLRDFLSFLPKGKNKMGQKESVFFQSVNQPAVIPAAQNTPSFVADHAFATQEATTTSAVASVASAAPHPAQETTSDQTLQQTAALLEKELKEAKAKEAAQPQIDSKEYLDAHQKVLELQNNLSNMLLEKQQLEAKLVDLQKKLTSQTGPVFSPSLATAAPAAPAETKFVRSVPQAMQKSVGLPITPEFPNVITGIVKDPRGNPLSNILVEVKDEQGNAVRAFKTNALGQFASATPLSNGSFTIEFEDPKEQNKFDKVAFKAGGEIILPIEVISVDTREELRRSLFN
jgi:hypothetical protein